MLRLTLYDEVSAALQVSNHSRVLSLFAVVHIANYQFVGSLLRKDGVVLTGLQLHIIKHPFYRDVVLRDPHFKHRGSTQQGCDIFRLLQDLDG